MLGDSELEASAVVANCAMNRGRGLDGYRHELGVDVVAKLRDHLKTNGTAAWVDLCCGEGRALAQAARRLATDRVEFVGVDLVDHFVPYVPPSVRLVTAALPRWRPVRVPVDLVTCVHGLHYVGDKLAALAAAVSWLAPDGLLVANFDPAGVRGVPARTLIRALRDGGLEYDARRKVVRGRGGGRLVLPYDYLGADDRAGPNYTGQAAVISHYAVAGEAGAARASGG